MDVELKKSSKLKGRSNSMPVLHQMMIPQPIHKSGRSIRQIEYEKIKLKNHQIPVISLLDIKDKEEEDITSKIKAIAERSLKKLEEKYQTIDRWKNRYLSEGIDRQRNINNLEDALPQIKEDKHKQSVVLIEAPKKSKQTSKLVPIKSKEAVTQEISDQCTQRRRLQNQLMDRLQRNKNYYQMQSQINYFEQLPKSIVLDKKKDLLSRKGQIQQTKQQLKELFSKKCSSIDYESKFLKRQHKKRAPEKVNPERQTRNFKGFKTKIWQQIGQSTPTGWNVQNQANDAQQL